jgi:hypothetical protein
MGDRRCIGDRRGARPMTGHLWKIALVVTMMHVLRELGRRFGPRWGALALGLPCSTAVALIGCGYDLGVDEAVAMAGSSLIGLVGAAALPVAFAWATGRGWGPSRSAATSVAAYLLLATIAARIDAPAEVATPVVIVAIVLSSGHATRGPVGRGRPGRIGLSMRRTLALRTMVPVACLSASIVLGRALGPSGAGLMSAFPAVTMTVLVLTELEAGTSAAIRMARALPISNLGMVAFLLVFRLGCPAMGLASGAMCSYLASLVMLGTLVVLEDRRGPTAFRHFRRGDPGRSWPIGRPSFEGSVRPSWPRAGRRFSPLVESFAS